MQISPLAIGMQRSIGKRPPAKQDLNVVRSTYVRPYYLSHELQGLLSKNYGIDTELLPVLFRGSNPFKGSPTFSDLFQLLIL